MPADTNIQPEPGLPTGTCSLCGASLDDVRRVGMWGDRDCGFGAWHSARCTTCDVDFRLNVQRAVAGEWRIDAPDANDLASLLTASEIESLSANFDRYKIHGAKWSSFLARRRPGDEVWRFKAPEGRTGIAVVRRGRPIAQFQVLESLLGTE
jgi:hypothetical protein